MPKTKKKRRVLDWEDWYLLAARYRQEQGDLLIPRDYECPGGQKLGRWIERQRAKHNRVPTMQGHLEPVQVEMLDAIGMVWKLETRRPLEIWLELLDEYAREHSNVDVPHEYVVEDCGLGDWLAKQRLRYAAGELSPKEIAQLEARGVNWSLRTRTRPWDDWFADAESYYRQHGNLMVPLDHRTPEGHRLGFWIYRQRDIYMGRKAGLRLTDSQIRRLDGIGMIWSPLASRPDDWERMARWVAEYKAANHKLPLWPRSLKAPDGRSAPGWIGAQRQLLAEGKLSPERKERLASLGIYPAERQKIENAG